MSTRVHRKSVKYVVSTKIHPNCPQKFTNSPNMKVHKNSPIMSIRIQPKWSRKYPFFWATIIFLPFKKDFTSIVLHTYIIFLLRLERKFIRLLSFRSAWIYFHKEEVGHPVKFKYSNKAAKKHPFWIWQKRIPE